MWTSRMIIVLALCAEAIDIASAQVETISMSVLNSRRHRLAASDNPPVGLFVSSDHGTTWVHRGWEEYIRTFYTEAGSDGVIWSACGNGVLRSTDGGASWRITTGWDVTEVLKVKVNPRDPKLVAATTAYGAIVTNDGGETWRTTSAGMEHRLCSDVVWIGGDRNVLLAATETGISRSVDGGISWHQFGLRGKEVRVLVKDPHGERRLWAGTEEDGVFLSTDGGRRWRQRTSGITHKTVYTLAISPADSNTVFAGTFAGGVYRTNNCGEQWVESSSGLTNLDVHALLVLPSNPSVVFAGTLNGGLFISRDGGAHWEFNSQEDAQVWGLSVRQE